MEAQFVSGLNIQVDYTPGSAVAVGQVVVVNGSCRIAHAPIAANALGSLSICGVYDVAKDGEAAVTFADGDPVFFSDSTNLATATNTDTWMGECVKAAGATDTTVRVMVFPRGTLYSGNLAASGTLTVTSNATIGGTLGVTGATTLSSTLAVTGNVAVNTNKFNITAASGNTTIAGTLVLSGKLSQKVIATPVAATGSAAGDAAAIGAANIVVVSSDSAAKGVKLLTGVAGDIITIINSSSTACEIYPATGGTINGGSADAPVTIPASKGVLAVCTAADTWTIYDLAAKST